ncbi:MAG: dienelactone hydrolase family protein [Alphaproteobacteria bacterium]|nr:dienelactone hydrolase family protein [Alphaproteobacteria bacterium]
MFRSISILPLLVACAPEPTDDTPATPPALVCDDASCVRDGDHRFDDAGSSRRVLAFMPEETAGAPVLFVFHHLGGSPEELLSWMPVDRAVEDGFIVVAPASRGLFGSEWAVTGAPGSNADVKLFDALLDSLIEVQAADPDHVYVTGFSAGGLFTSYLTMHRAERIAATAPFSGGAPEGTYVTPATDLPVMLSWGGSWDSYGGFDFEDATLNLASELVADGHVVQACDHGLGHWLPADAAERTRTFFGTHATTGRVADFAACVRMEP